MARRPRVSLIYYGTGDPVARVVRGLAEIAVPAGWIFQPFCEPDPATSLRSALAWESEVVVVWYPSGVVLPQSLKAQTYISLEVDRTDQGIPSVMLDDQAVGRLAAEHLLDRGLKHFVAFGDRSYPFSQRRVSGFRQRVLDAGGAYLEGEPTPEEFARETLEGHIHWQRRLCQFPKPLGVFTPSDAWASQVIRLCQMNELAVPEQVAVVGACNDRFFCEISTPRLSSVSIPWEKMGRAAAELVSQRLAGAVRIPSVTIGPDAVVVRSSSDILVEASPEVLRAVRYIAENACGPLQVGDVVRHVVTYRRALERGFKRYLKRSIAQEIRRVRIERAKQLLVTTRLRMPDIAAALGFQDPSSLYDAFSREVGMPPSRYRLEYHTEE